MDDFYIGAVPRLLERDRSSWKLNSVTVSSLPQPSAWQLEMVPSCSAPLPLAAAAAPGSSSAAASVATRVTSARCMQGHVEVTFGNLSSRLEWNATESQATGALAAIVGADQVHVIRRGSHAATTFKVTFLSGGDKPLFALSDLGLQNGGASVAENVPGGLDVKPIVTSVRSNPMRLPGLPGCLTIADV